MATRGFIARYVDEGKFRGRYHHWDSYPGGLGATLWRVYNVDFKKDLASMMKVLIDEHPAGWSTINGTDFKLKPGYIEAFEMPIKGETPEQYDARRNKQPKCYCHGERNEGPNEISEINASGMGCEYGYVFKSDNTMLILSSYRGDGSKMIGYFGSGDPKAAWRIVAQVDLNGQEPDWGSIDCEDD